jgi:hypothetical protein
VAGALRETYYYVEQKCRRREWPHRRGARGVPTFTAEDVAEIVALIAAPVEAEAQQRFAMAPRSRRAS